MMPRTALLAACVGLLVLAGGCVDLTGMLNPEFAAALRLTSSAASLPGDAPGLLVTVENRTDRWASVVVSYRDVNRDVVSYTTLVPPQSRTGQMLTCPVPELTIGDVANRNAVGARIYVVDTIDTAALDSTPYLDVEPFGVLLQEGANYNCGDGLLLTVQPSSLTRSGYQTYVYVRRSGL